MNSPGKIVYLMRGLPATGKSHTAKKLAGENGVICETDEYFHTEVGEEPRRFERFVASGTTPIVVDRGNSLSTETQRYARYAVDHGFRVELKEPESDWWQEIRVLLKDKELIGPVLDRWAEELARYSSSIHRFLPRPSAEEWRNEFTA